MEHNDDCDSSGCEEIYENESEESNEGVQEVESTLIVKPKTKSAV